MCGQKYLYALHLALIVDNNGFQAHIIRVIKFKCPITSGLKRCQSKNPRFSRVFFVFRRFLALCAQRAAFLEIRILVQIKRCQSTFWGEGPEMNLSHAFLGEIFVIFHRKYLPLFSLLEKIFVKKYVLKGKLKMASSRSPPQ